MAAAAREAASSSSSESPCGAGGRGGDAAREAESAECECEFGAGKRGGGGDLAIELGGERPPPPTSAGPPTAPGERGAAVGLSMWREAGQEKEKRRMWCGKREKRLVELAHPQTH